MTQTSTAAVPVIFDPEPPVIAEQTTEAAKTDCSATAGGHDDSSGFREEIHRRYEEPFVTSWLHGGLNE